jgi:starvation-inducible outer membrane lipoprotein
MTVSKTSRMQQGSLTLVTLALLLAACSTASDTIVTEEVVLDEEVVEEEAPATVTFSRPADCTSVLTDQGLRS